MDLDSRGLVDGAVQGFGLMDRYYRGQKQDDRAERGLQMQEEAFGMKKEQYGREQTKEKATFVLGKIAQGVDLSEDEYAFLKEHPQFWPALDPRTDKSIEVAQSVIDPESPAGPNDPEAIDAMNQLWGHRINRGEGGKKRIAGLYPGQQPGTVALDLEVEREDGTKYNAPMTRNRGVEGDDEILQTPVGDLVEQVQGYRMLRNVFRTPEAQATASKVLAALTGKTPERTKGININGQLVNPETGEAIGDFRTPEQRGERGSGKAPADVQTAEWMVENGLAPNLDVAFNRVNESRTDPARFVNDFVTQEMKFQESSGIFPGDENYRTPEQIREQAIDTLAMIRARTRGTNESPNGDDDRVPGLQIVSSKTEQLPADGSGVEQPDGSYSGRVNRDTTAASSKGELRPFKPGEKVNNPDGSYSTERTITVGVDGQYMNIPTLWMGANGPEELSEQEAVTAARDYMQRSGQKFPSFKTIDQAVQAAEKRSDAGGAGQTIQAPAAAVEHLKKNPQLADQFQKKYGYLPEGF